MVIDCHAHLEEIPDLEQALKRADEAGVTGIIALGMYLESNKKTLEIYKKYKNPIIYTGLGIHPSYLDISEIEECFELIEKNISELVAIGEIGLDYWTKFPDCFKDKNKKRREIEETYHNAQKQVFERALDLAKKYSKPVIIHSRGAWSDCYEIVKNKNIEKAVFHWYSGPEDVLKKILDSDYYISATPGLEYSKEHRTAVINTPFERIIAETDCPVRYRTQTGESFPSEPKDVLRTIRLLSVIKETDIDKVKNIVFDNMKKIFTI